MENLESDNKTAKKKLSDEELLAGKCAAEEDALPLDPRFKSPDDILLQLMAQKRSMPEMTIHHGYNRGETILRADDTIQRIPDSLTLRNDLQALNQRYETDKKRWKDYEKRILEWKEQVMNVVESLKNEIRQKDEEIRKLSNKK